MGDENVLQLVVVMFVHARPLKLYGLGDFPRGAVGMNPPASAGSLISGGEDSTCHGVAVVQVLKPMCPEPVLCRKRSYCNEKPAHLNGE